MSVTDLLDLAVLCLLWNGYGAIAAGYWFTHWQLRVRERDGEDAARQAETRHAVLAVLLACIGGFATLLVLTVALVYSRVNMDKWWREARFYDLY